MLENDDNIQFILQESALREKNFSLFDFAECDNPNAKPKPSNEEDTLKAAMVDAIDETDAVENGEIIDPEAEPGKTCQTFFMPTEIKKRFESICKNNYTTPSAFLRNVCARLVETYYGKKD